MKRIFLSLLLILSLLATGPVLAKDGADDSSGSSSSSSDDSSSSSSGNSSRSSSDDSSSSSSGLEVETEHGVTFLKPHGGSSGVDISSSNSSASEGLEIETEHGVTFLKAHSSGGNSTVQVGLSSFGMEVETEHGVTYLKPHGSRTDSSLEDRLSGRILINTQANGEAWWVDPKSNGRVFLGRPADALEVMRRHGLGISNSNLSQIQVDDNSGRRSSSRLASQLAGRILLQVEDKGKAWYIDPVTLKRIYLGRPADALNVMKARGLGITEDNLNRVRLLLGTVGARQLEIALLTDSGSGQVGIAEIKEVGGQVKVQIKLSGAPIGSVQPAHIHTGSRASMGAIKYSLNNVVNGVSETVINVSFDSLISQRPLVVNVHKSAAEMNVSVVSGNL